VAARVAWSRAGCQSVILWLPPEFARYTFRAPGPCPQTGTGRSLSAVGTDGEPVLWLADAAGNTREWSLCDVKAFRIAPVGGTIVQTRGGIEIRNAPGPRR
jgi:hypothetical protein